MNDFYHKILNIGNSDVDTEKEIDLTIREYFSVFPENYEGMCEVHTINIEQMLKKKKIRVYKINSLNLGASYEHHFLIVDTKEKEMFLIDPTFSQFDSNGRILINKKLNSFPSVTLNQTDKGKIIYQNLITNKYSKVDIEEIMLYLNSLETKKIASVDDLIIAASK